MKLNTKVLRYLTNEDWKVLAAVEHGSKNHELVPTAQIIQFSHLRSPSAVHKSISTLAKANLIARLKNAAYDGYRLTYGGLDYLALHAHTRADALYSVGNQIGVGKESDIFVAAAPDGTQHVLKIHRLGRISFRRVRNTRDYLRGKAARQTGAGAGGRGGSSWMHMSRLAALKEYTFMGALRDAGFRVPRPVAHNRHTLVMELFDAFPLRKIASVPDPAGLYAELMEMIVQLAQVGLIHGDFNEFNILIREDPADPSDGNDQSIDPEDTKQQTDSAATTTVNAASSADTRLTPILIDFPQMVSTSHENAQMYFDRDVHCIKYFFERRFGFTSDEPGPFFAESTATMSQRLDVQVEASGFSKKMARELEAYMKEVGVDGDRPVDGEVRDEDDEDEEDEESDGDDNEEGENKEAEESPASTLDQPQPQGIPDDLRALGRGVTNIQIEEKA